MSDNLDKELEEIMRIVNIDHTKPTANTHQRQHPRQRTPQHSQKGQAPGFRQLIMDGTAGLPNAESSVKYADG